MVFDEIWVADDAICDGKADLGPIASVKMPFCALKKVDGGNAGFYFER